jgi:hypothetical protein
MMRRRYYNVFISHAWRYSEDYEGVIRLLEAAPRFKWKDYSVCCERSLAEPGEWLRRKQIKVLIAQRIALSSCFVLTAGMYVCYRRWIQDEIDLAIEMDKPIVAILARGQQRAPREIEDYADRICGWRSKSLVKAIRTAVRDR